MRSCPFRRLELNHLNHEEFVYNAFMKILKHQSFGCVNFQRQNLSSFIKMIFMFFSKMNKTLMGLEQQEAEYLMT